METRKQLAELPQAGKIKSVTIVTSASFSHNGKFLATVSRKIVQFWDVPALPLVPTSELIDVACSHLTANISQSEWQIIFPGEDYRPICPNLGQNTQ